MHISHLFPCSEHISSDEVVHKKTIREEERQSHQLKLASVKRSVFKSSHAKFFMQVFSV